MAEARPDGAWSLEVVRGAEIGRRLALPAGETVAGNALKGAAGLDLSGQESGPRRMAPRQARFQCKADALTLLDLGSPGGTFVNRERLAPFQPRALRPGDVIQMAGVQLRVERGTGPPAASTAAPPARPPTAPAAGFRFRLKSGTVCRSWDDFLTISAQDWAGLRDELVSGRLAAFLASTGRPTLAPDPNAHGSPDERLDAWLATVPSSRTPAPELEVHPDQLAVAFTAGGTTRRTLTVTNTGYRLLKTTARIEPAGTAWLRLVDATLVTVDRSPLSVEILMPESLPVARTASLVLESNGGQRRVAITLEPRTESDAPPSEGAGPSPLDVSFLGDRLRGVSPPARLIAGAAAGLLGRGAIALASGAIGGSGPSPRLLGPALLSAALGMILGTALMRRRGTWTDLPAGAVAGGVAGVLDAAVFVAACRAVESALGIGAGALALLTWGLIGAAIGGLSLSAWPFLRPEAAP